MNINEEREVRRAETEAARKELEAESNESIELAEDYYGYVEDQENGLSTPLSGTVFSIREDAVVIFQDTDDGEEPSKYIVIKADVPEELWERFLEVARAGEQF